MEIEILLNLSVANSSEIQRELSAELLALQMHGVTVSTKTAPPPENTLGILEDVFQFIIDNREPVLNTVPLVVAVVQVTREVLRRRNIQPPPKKSSAKNALPNKQRLAKQKSARKPKAERQEPVAVIVVDNNRLNLPCTPAQADEFIKKVRKASNKPKSSAK